ncbi:MAG: response regulator [Nitrospiraceae bacterium]|nr:MAG: response regulator [Nitrospiraceae bacterium]
MTAGYFKYKRALVSFMAILLVFLILADVLIVSNQRKQMLNEVMKHRGAELDLVGMFITESLLKHEYASVENFLAQWAGENDDIVKINAVAPNNFLLMQYERAVPSAHSFAQEKQIRYGGRNLMTLNVVRDFTSEEKILTGLQKNLTGVSVVLVMILGTALWFSMRRMAFMPLETEIAVRRQAEETLQKVRDGLEIKVQERTRELNDINKTLLLEIEERKRGEEALVKSEEKFSKAFRSSPTLMSISTLNEGRFIDVNHAFLNALKYTREEVIGHTSSELGIWTVHADRDKMVSRLREQGIVRNFETAMRTSNGEVLTVLLSAEMIKVEDGPCIIAVILDITERKRLEAQLLHAQKMEAVGQLAGGVAHDFNNILTAIIGNCYLLKKALGEDHPKTDVIGNILLLSDNAAKITRELLTFSRRQYIKPEPVRLNDIITGTNIFLRNFIGEDIEIRTMLAEEKLTIMADRTQVEQVMMNLAANARDAMPDGGVLTIETELVELDGKFIRTHGFGSPGMYALLSVTDTGTGMDEEIRRKIFEPFFTTKEMGKGTGLGLAIVYGIVKQHNGYINVYSRPGKGTTFRIYLPEIETEVKVEKEEVAFLQLKGNGEAVLLAEDEPAVREPIKRILEEFDYRVIEAVDGEDAVNKFFQHKDRIDLLIFDVVMPRMSGPDAIAEIRRTTPGVKAILTSGYAGDRINILGIEDGGTIFVPKPVSPENLLSRMREMLR